MRNSKQRQLLSGTLWVSIGITLVTCKPAAEKAPSPTAVSTSFAKLLHRFKRVMPWDTLLPVPLIYRAHNTYNKLSPVQYEVWVANHPIGLRPRVVQLRDPAKSSEGYPVSYSVLYQKCVVALFKGGNFGCFRLTDLMHNQQLEAQLNTRKWQRNWIIDNQLVALNQGRYYVFDLASRAWLPYRKPVPFGTAPKLFEDTRYLVYADCQGEFGGSVYFFNKQTRQIHRANATCATSVWSENGQYRVLASLAHGLMASRSAIIANPEILPLASAPKDDQVDWQYDFKRSEKGVIPVFDYTGLLLFGGFHLQNQTVYLTHWRNTTFLATVADRRLTIIDPLFSNWLYTHEPVTTSYGARLAMTNLDFYGLGGSSEVAALL
jgi:hypothetical protein